MSSTILEINQDTCITHAEVIDRALTVMEGKTHDVQHSIIMVAVQAQTKRSQKLWIAVRQFTGEPLLLFQLIMKALPVF